MACPRHSADFLCPSARTNAGDSRGFHAITTRRDARMHFDMFENAGSVSMLTSRGIRDHQETNSDFHVEITNI